MSFSYTSKLMRDKAAAERRIVDLLSSASGPLAADEIVARLRPTTDPKIAWDCLIEMLDKKRITPV